MLPLWNYGIQPRLLLHERLLHVGSCGRERGARILFFSLFQFQIFRVNLILEMIQFKIGHNFYTVSQLQLRLDATFFNVLVVVKH